MHKIKLILCVVLLSFNIMTANAFAQKQTFSGKEAPQILWHPWTLDVFDKAKSEKRYVLLDLYAKWCHWCHFMERRTYAHPVIRKMVHDGYLAVKADQDAHPDLGSRYGDWGWPATIIFDSEGNEVAKLQGFLRPSSMAQILYTIRHHPDRVPALRKETEIKRGDKLFLNDQQKQKILTLLEETYDVEHGGWGRRLKFLQPEVIEYAMDQARLGNVKMRERVLETLDAALSLMDQEWGGVYQYSHERDWSAPHYEKIMWSQVKAIELYSYAYSLFGKDKYLKAARKVSDYLINYLLGQNGAFYTSQDADVDEKILGKEFYQLTAEKRKALGKFPKIDKNQYARENGWAISGLLALHRVTGDAELLKISKKVAKWVIDNRSLNNGGFQHGENDKGGPFLSDNLAMSKAFLDLYSASGDEEWLKLSAKTAGFISATFKYEVAGYITTKTPSAKTGVFQKPFLNIEENIRFVRLSNAIYRTLGEKRFKKIAKHAMTYLATDAITNRRRFLLGVILADQELSVEPAHITVVGSKTDPQAKALHVAALKLALPYKRVDWWDPSQGPMLNQDVKYPELETAAVFACANQICSLPVYEPADLRPVVARMMKQRVVRRSEQ